MQSQKSEYKELPIYDIYVLTEGGIPIFAGCSTSDYCASHEGQHPLHAGFIHAIQNFGNEVFSSGIKDLKFDTVKLNFKSVEQYTIIFVNPLAASDTYIKKKLMEVSDLLKNKYMDRIQVHSVSEEIYHEFIDDIVGIGLIPKDRVKLTRSIFKSESSEIERKKPEKKSIYSRFKSKFETLIGR